MNSIDRIVSIWDAKGSVTNFYTDGVWEGQVKRDEQNGTLTACYSYVMAGGDVATSYETARGISGKYSTRAFKYNDRQYRNIDG